MSDARDLDWADARRRAAAAGAPVEVVVLPLGAAGGAALAENACARTDLPADTTSAMDGWAVAGAGPWRVVGEVLAGRGWGTAALAAGDAVRIATGAVLPPGATAVLRREAGREGGGMLHAGDAGPAPGTDVRPAGSECRAGDVVLGPGTDLAPVAIGLLAAAGLDRVAVRRPRADVLILGDELLSSGPARDGRLRDALGPLLSVWLPARGIEIASRGHVPDLEGTLRTALRGCLGDVVVTTGSTARGPVDHLHTSLAALGAQWVVDGVRVRPGHPMLLAVLPDGRPVVGLPGNPLAAVSALLTLFDPLVRSLRGHGPAPRRTVVLTEAVDAGPEATRLLPVRLGRPVTFAGPAMLRGLAAADTVAVIPPGGLPAGAAAEALDLPG